MPVESLWSLEPQLSYFTPADLEEPSNLVAHQLSWMKAAYIPIHRILLSWPAMNFRKE